MLESSFEPCENLTTMELVKSTLREDFHFEYFDNIISRHTKESYRRDIVQFVSFLRDFFPAIKGPSELRVPHILKFRNFLRDERKYAPKSINRKLSSLSDYFDFLVEKEVLQFNPVKSIKRSKSNVVTPTEALDDDEVKKIFALVEQSNDTLKKAAVYLLFSTGIRKAELVNIRIRDFLHENKSIFLHVRGKGEKEVYKLIPQWVWESVQEHINFLKSKGETTGPEEYLLRIKRKSSCNLVSQQFVYNLIKNLAKSAGITKNISPHSVRATYVTAALASGVDIYKVAADCGHARIDTTAQYNKRIKAKTESPVNAIGFLKKHG